MIERRHHFVLSGLLLASSLLVFAFSDHGGAERALFHQELGADPSGDLVIDECFSFFFVDEDFEIQLRTSFRPNFVEVNGVTLYRHETSADSEFCNDSGTLCRTSIVILENEGCVEARITPQDRSNSERRWAILERVDSQFIPDGLELVMNYFWVLCLLVASIVAGGLGLRAKGDLDRSE